VPAAAVIPALIAYTKVAAVKKLVVGFWRSFTGSRGFGSGVGVTRLPPFRRPVFLFTERRQGFGAFTLKKLECSKQADATEHISME